VNSSQLIFWLLGSTDKERSYSNKKIYPLHTRRAHSKKSAGTDRTGVLSFSPLPHAPLSHPRGSGKSRILAKGMPPKKFHIQFDKFILVIQ
jgi:hypothetical protein